MRRSALLPVLALAGAAACGEALGPETPAAFDAVFAGGYHSCALAGGDAFCWGDDRFGQLGAVRDDHCAGRVCTHPVPVAGWLRFETLAAGLWHTCGTADGGLYCWGYHRFGQVGAGDTVAERCADEWSLPCASVPTAALTGLAFEAVTAARYHACALDTDGRAYCWGGNSQGQNGSGDTFDRNHPHPVDTELTFDGLTTGYAHTCGRTPDGRIYCWGAGTAGRLGYGGNDPLLRPVAPVYGNQSWRQVNTGEGGHTCAVSSEGAVFCWGLGADGQLGGGDRVSRARPQAVPLPEPARAVSAGGYHSCAIGESGALFCWGANDAGQIGDGTRTMRLAPVVVDVGAPVTAVSTGMAHSCALTDAGRLLCWGDNSSGQLGDGTRERRLLPTPVVP